MLDLMRKLFPICRSITGDGVRATLRILQEKIPSLSVREVPSGTRAFDWRVPDEWNIDNAFVENAQGHRIIDMHANNLHVVGYSVPTDKMCTLAELQSHLHSLKDQADAIPYVTSYYERAWGFCLSHHQRESLGDGPYRVKIDSTLTPGAMSYGELVIPGDSPKEILFSTNICHPSLASNELSGPIVATHLARFVANLPNRRFTYRFLFIPETIGAIVYLSQHLQHLQRHVQAGFVLTCLGDNRGYSYLPSRNGDTLADRVALDALHLHAGTFERYTFLDRGADERQYCAPGIDLPVVSLMRSKHSCFPEYHTSLDNLDLVSEDSLQGSLELCRTVVRILEANRTYRATVLCEPQMGQRGLYPTLSKRESRDPGHQLMMNCLAYADGATDLLQMAEVCGVSLRGLLPSVERLQREGLLAANDNGSDCHAN